MIPVNVCDPAQEEMTQFVCHDTGKNLRRIGPLVPSKRLYPFVESIGQSTIPSSPAGTAPKAVATTLSDQ